MIIVREGSEGVVAIALPHTLQSIAESICDALGREYPRACVRVVVNHCLAPEIIRTDRISDLAYARRLIETLRVHAGGAEPAGTLHERAAVVLGWSPAEAQAFSLSALRDLVRPHDHRLARAFDHAIATNGGAKSYCCFCSGEVAPADFVIYAHVPNSERPAHKACVDADAERRSSNTEDMGLQMLVSYAFLLYPAVAFPHLPTEALQALCVRVLPALA